MTIEMTATKAKNNFGTVLDTVYAKGNTVIVTRNKRKLVEIKPMETTKSRTYKSTMSFTDSEWKGIKKAMKEFRDNFSLGF